MNNGSFSATGSVYLLWVAIDRYANPFWPTLRTAVSGSEALEEALSDGYGLEDDHVIRLVNQGANLAEIERCIRAFGPGGSMELSQDDQLLISFAGHGEEDPLTHETAFVPYDGHADSPSTWFRFDHLRSLLRVIEARHVLVVSDSCFSGGVFRSSRTQLPDKIDEMYAKRAYASKSRLMISSGGNEIVADAGGGHGKSVFVQGILNALSKRSTPWVLAEEIFRDTRRFVVENSEQTPEFGGLERSGHDGGQFVLFRRSSKDDGYARDDDKIIQPRSTASENGRTPKERKPELSTRKLRRPESRNLLKVSAAALSLLLVVGGAYFWTPELGLLPQSNTDDPEIRYDLSDVRLDIGPITLRNFSLPYDPPLTLNSGHEFEFNFFLETIDLEPDGGALNLFVDPVPENESCQFGRYTTRVESNMNERINFGIGNMTGCSSSKILGVDISFKTDSGDIFPAMSLRFQNYISSSL